MAILVVGAGGFLGRAVAARLAELHVPAVLWSRTSGPGMLRVDLLRDEALPPLPRDVQAVVHLAAHAVPGAAFTEKQARENLALCERMLAALHGRRLPFVLASSAHVYAPAPHAHAEDELPAPATLYGRSKLACEEACRSSAHVEARVVRLFGTAGPGLPRGLMLSDALERARRGEDPLLMRGPDGWRDLLDVRDAADALVALALAPRLGSCTVNLAGGRPRRAAELVERMLAALPRPPAVRWPAGEAPAVLADTRRMAGLGLWSPCRDLDACLRSMAVQDAGLQDETGSAIVQG